MPLESPGFRRANPKGMERNAENGLFTEPSNFGLNRLGVCAMNVAFQGACLILSNENH
jgi:hypothetical protein